jgi:hypothetical protein
VDEIFTRRIVLPGFKLGESILSTLQRFESLSPEQLDQQVDDALELIEEFELRLLKAEGVYLHGLAAADRAHHAEIERTIGRQIELTAKEMGLL